MNRVRKAFTLVEILIVVIILGILAAIVVPQFTSASEEAQLSNAQSQLQTIRNMIELYRVRNNGEYPASFAAGTWDDLVGADYLRSPPINPRTGESTITPASIDPNDDTVGWMWNEDALTGIGTLRCAMLAEEGIDADCGPGLAFEETGWRD